MSTRPDVPLEERVAALERSVEQLSDTVRRLVEALASRDRATRDPSTRPTPSDEAVAPQREPGKPPRPAPVPRKRPTYVRQAQALPGSTALAGLRDKGMGFWLSRIGIGLLLLGVVFVFKYAVDKGWLTPTIRVGFGLALGAALAAIGLRIEAKRRWFAPLMFGGASATFYITGFAAFQLFQLVGYPVALAFMVVVTVFTFWAAVRTDVPLLGILAAIGGLGTPFLLYTDRGSVAGLVLYTILVLGGTTAIYLHRGWRSLLWTSVIGGWSVFAIGLVQIDSTSPDQAEQWALQLGAWLALAAFWLVPVLRDVLAVRNPAAWPEPSLAEFAKVMGMPESRVRVRSAQILTVTTPVVAFFLSRAIWPYSDPLASGMATGLALLLLAGWWQLEGKGVDAGLRSMHAVAAAVLVAIALQYLFRNHTLLLTWSVEILALHVVARRFHDRPLAVTAHLVGVVVAAWLGVRLFEQAATPAVLNVPAVTDAVTIGVLGIVSSQVPTTEARRWYLLGALVALSAWCWRELGALPDGARYVLVAWSAIGTALLALGRGLGDRYYQLAGHVLFGLAAFVLVLRLIEEPSGLPVVNLRALLHVLALTVALGASSLERDREAKVAYRLVVHGLLLGWLWHELSRLPGGQGFVSIAWGIYALGLMLVGLRRDMSTLRKLALATFLAVVVKLFLVDLSQLDPLWRILLFLGFGGLFLLLSYYFPTLWRGSEEKQP